MSAPKAHSHYAEPTGADRQWLTEQIENARVLVARYTDVQGWAENDLDALDRAYEAWSHDPSNDRPTSAFVAQACGTAIGSLAARRVGLKWMVAPEVGPGRMVLWGRSASGSDVWSAPIAMVGERMEDGMVGFLAVLADGICESLRDSMGE